MPELNQFFNALFVKRDGLFTLQKAARTICIVARWAAPVIQSKYPNNALLMAALQAAMVACQELDLEIEKQRQYNSENPPDTGVPFPVPPPIEEPEG